MEQADARGRSGPRASWRRAPTSWARHAARLQALEGERDRLARDLGEREVKLAQLRDRTTELEAKSAEYEDQILRAYQKLRADEKLFDRAKRALAVALQVLDERAITPGASPAPSTTSPRPSPRRSPPAKTPGPAG